MRSYVHTGGNYRNFYGNSESFHKWRVYLNLNDGHLRYNFIGKHNGACGSPFNYNLLDFINFDNQEDIERFKSDMLVEIEKAKTFPDRWKEQKSKAIKSINYAKKNWPKDFEKPKVIEWLAFLLPILRKRT